MGMYPSEKETEWYATDGVPHKILDFGDIAIYQRFVRINSISLPQKTEVIIDLPTTGWGDISMARLCLVGVIDVKSFIRGLYSDSTKTVFIFPYDVHTSPIGGSYSMDIIRDQDNTTLQLNVKQSMTGTGATDGRWQAFIWINYPLGNVL